MTRFDKVIPPGAEGKVYASVDISHIKGPVQKGIDVTTNDPDQPNINLVIKASVKTLVDFSPQEQIHFNVAKGTLATQELIVTADPSVKLSSPVIDSDMISVKMVPDKNGKQRLIVDLKRSDIIGTHATEIKIPVQGRIKEVTVPVVMAIRGPIQVTPGFVSFVLRNHPEEVLVTKSSQVRQAADASSMVMESVAVGRSLKVLGESGGWYQVLTFEKRQKTGGKSVPYRRMGWIPVAVVKPSRATALPQPQQVSVQSSTGKSFQVLGVSATIPQVKVEKKMAGSGDAKQYQLSVSLQQLNLDKKGNTRGEILVNTDNADQPLVRIPVFVNIL